MTNPAPETRTPEEIAREIMDDLYSIIGYGGTPGAERRLSWHEKRIAEALTAERTTEAAEARLAAVERAAKALPVFRRALESAAILLNINDSTKQPYTSGYDSVHDAYNEVWHAWQTAERLSSALPLTAQLPTPPEEGR